MRRIWTLLLLSNLGLFGQAPSTTNPPSPFWQVIGIGTLAQRPVCPGAASANRSVYICQGAGCTGGNIIHFCTASGWDVQGTAAGSGVTSVNGLIASTQSFALGTSGTAPNINSATSTHTFNFPLASAAGVTAGLVSNSWYVSVLTNSGGPYLLPTATAPAGTPTAGNWYWWFDTIFNTKDPSGSFSNTVIPVGATTHQWLTNIDSSGNQVKSQPASADLSDALNIPHLNTTNTWNGTNNFNAFTDLHLGSMRWAEITVATLPAAASASGKIYLVTDAASTSTCSSGGGTSTPALCWSSGSAWVPIGGSGGGGGGGVTNLNAGSGVNVSCSGGTVGSCTPSLDTAYTLSLVDTSNHNFTGNNQMGTGTLGLDVTIANDGAGSTLNKFVKITSSGTVTTAATTDTRADGIVYSGASTTGNARITVIGQVQCVFDSAAAPTAGDYVQLSSTVAGACKDVGTSLPSGWYAGKVVTSGLAGSTQTVLLQGAGSGSAGSGTPGGSPGQIQYNSAGSFGGANISQDATHGQIIVSKALATAASAACASATTGASNVDTSLSNRCEVGVLTGNLTVTFTNLKAGQKFSVSYTQATSPTGPFTVSYAAVVTNTACQISQVSAVTTVQSFEVASDGVTVYGRDCTSTDTPTIIAGGPTRSAPSGNPGAGTLDFWFDSTYNEPQAHDSSGNLITMPKSAAGFTASAGLPFGIDTTNKNGHILANGADAIIGAIPTTPVNGNCVKWSVVGSTVLLADQGAACGTGGGGSTAWSGITNPTGNLSLTMGADTSLFTFNASTGAATDLWTLTDTLNNTGTGFLMHLKTASGSALSPFAADSNGNGVKLDATGLFQPTGTGVITANQVNGAVVPTSASLAGTNSSKQIVAATGHAVSSVLTCAAASASGTAYTCSTSPTFTPAAGDLILFKADVANTGAATLVVNSQAGTPGIKKQGGGTDLIANDLLASQYVTMTFDGTNWQMGGQTGNAASGTSKFLGPTIQGTANWSPGASTLYYAGFDGAAPQASTLDARTQWPAPFAGTFNSFSVRYAARSTQSAGTVVVTMYKNGSACNLTVSFALSSYTPATASDTGHTCAFLANDLIEVQISTPAWSPLPTGVDLTFAMSGQ